MCSMLDSDSQSVITWPAAWASPGNLLNTDLQSPSPNLPNIKIEVVSPSFLGDSDSKTGEPL